MSALCADTVSLILSFLSPADVISCSLVSKMWCAASKADCVWRALLPPAFHSPLVQSAPAMAAHSSSLRSAYIALSRGLVVADGLYCVQVEPLSGRVAIRVNIARAGRVLRGASERSARMRPPLFATRRAAPGASFPAVPVVSTADWFEARGCFLLPFPLRPGSYKAAWRVARLPALCCGDIPVGCPWQLPGVMGGAGGGAGSLCLSCPVRASSSLRFAGSAVPQDSCIALHRGKVPAAPQWAEIPAGWHEVRPPPEQPAGPLEGSGGEIHGAAAACCGRGSPSAGAGGGAAAAGLAAAGVQVEASLREAGTGRCSFLLDSLVLREVAASEAPFVPQGGDGQEGRWAALHSPLSGEQQWQPAGVHASGPSPIGSGSGNGIGRASQQASFALLPGCAIL